MAIMKTVLAAVPVLALILAGCSSTRFASTDQRPEPLQPAPSGTVTATALPPPAAPGMTDPSQFPDAPAATDIAALPGADPAAGAPELTTGSVAGVWNATVSGQTCKVATPQTKFGAGFRAGPLRCPAPVDGVKSWNVSGSQLSLYDESGSVLARLQSSGPGQFDGQTSTGLPISLSR
jgi:hypothetical protein